MINMKMRIKPSTLSLYVICVVLFCFFQMTYLGAGTGFTDENDNYIAALVLNNGGDIYADFSSQHMPLMYYLCGIMYYLGARSAYQYRFFFAIFTAILWGMIVIRYRKKMGTVAMVFGPLFYCGFINVGDFTLATVMSDKLQAYGGLILFLEFMCFALDKEMRISTDSCIWIAFAIFISIGSAFVAVFTVFWVFVCVVAMETRKAIKSQGSIVYKFTNLITKYVNLIVLSCLPFMVLFLWYMFTGNVQNFIDGAYSVNRTVYPKYLGGFGANALEGLIGAFKGYYPSIKAQLMQIDFFNLKSMVNVGIILVNLLFVLNCFAKDWLTGLCMAIITCQTAPRGLFGFHSMTHYLVSAYMASILVGDAIKYRIPKKRMSLLWINGGCSIVLLMLFIAPSVIKCKEAFKVKEYLEYQEHTREVSILQLLTEPGEYVGLVSAVANNPLLVKADRPPLYCSSGAPWMYEMFGNREYQNYLESPPRVLIYTPGYNVWGHNVEDYASDLISYIKDNYTNLVSCIWVHNDYLEIAERMTGIHPVQYVCGSPIGICEVTLVDVPSIKQFFKPVTENIEGISIMLGTYIRISDADIIVKLMDTDTGKILKSKEFSLKGAEDNSYFFMDFEYDGLSLNKQYCFELSSPNMNGDNAVVSYITPAKEDEYAEINQEKKDYSICFGLH